jgi:biopolymer transport protein ExbD
MGLRLKQLDGTSAEMDMTPMIDMTFQLIAFFMMLINFSQSETDRRIELPLSALAIPVEDSDDHNFITLHVDDKNDTIVMAADAYTIESLDGALAKRRNELETIDKLDTQKTRIIIRADAKAPTGLVQEVIGVCQKNRFENFKLRAEQDRKNN